MDSEAKTLPLPMARFAPRRWLRPLILVGVVVLIVAQILLLSPSSLEQTKTNNIMVDPQSLVPKTEVTLAPGIPSQRVPEYSINKFSYLSSQGIEKQWNLLAERANLYNAEKLVHARQVTAFLFNPDGQPTVVKGLEAKYVFLDAYL